MYDNKELLRQLDELRDLYAKNKSIQEDDTFKQLYKPVTVTYEIYRLAVQATDLWAEITSGSDEKAKSKSIEFEFDMRALKNALDRYAQQEGGLYETD